MQRALWDGYGTRSIHRTAIASAMAGMMAQPNPAVYEI